MYALDVKKLYKTYANGVQALNGIDLQVKNGDFFALLGANGAGKSTTIGVISTLLTKTSGSIIISGYDIESHSEQAKLRLGLVPQEINLNVFDSCEQILLTSAGYFGVPRNHAKERVSLLLNQLGLSEKRHHIVRQLSGGMKRRLMIARALMHKPDVLILDEPTAGVDVEIRRSVWNFLSQINAEGTTIILTTHYLEEAEQLCKNIAIIDQGCIIENTNMQKLLHSLQYETIVFNTIEPIDNLPLMHPFILKQLDAHTFELCIEKQYSINQVFALLDKHNIRINSMRNKTNRLEELFMNRISHAN